LVIKKVKSQGDPEEGIEREPSAEKHVQYKDLETLNPSKQSKRKESSLILLNKSLRI